MSDTPAEDIQLVPNPAPNRSVYSAPASNRPVHNAYEKPPGGLLWSFLFLACAAIAGSVPSPSWAFVLSRINLSAPPDAVRWIVAGVLGICGLLLLRRSHVPFVVYSIAFAGTLLCVYDLLQTRLSTGLLSFCRSMAALPLLAIAAFAFGFATLPRHRAEKPNLRGVLGLLLVAMASVGLAHGWFDWSKIAGRIGPGAVRLVQNWGEECTWATVLILTALGISSSRSRPIHFLNAILLVALAYECVKAGYFEVKNFPGVAHDGSDRSVVTNSYTNVETWRWIVAGELTVLTAILLHLAAGLGGLCIVFALAWMSVAMTVYKSVGTMSLGRTINVAISGAMDPLGGMGMPTGPANTAQPQGGLSSPGTSGVRPNSSADERRAMEIARTVAVRELTTLGWIGLTALLAGIVSAAGLAMISGSGAYRVWMLCVLWLALGMGAATLWSVWPRDPTQSWQSWGASLKFSRYHNYGIWIMFLASAAVGSAWAFFLSSGPRIWFNLAAAAVFIGTAASLVGAAVLIRFGDFPPLPVWVYCVIAAGQSSLAWALLMRANRVHPAAQARAA